MHATDRFAAVAAIVAVGLTTATASVGQDTPASLSAEGRSVALPAPAPDRPGGGVVRVGDDWWVAQATTVYVLRPKDAGVRREHELEFAPADLATDGRRIFALPAAWSAGEPIRVLDPASGEVAREIVTTNPPADPTAAARGLCVRDDTLYVLDAAGRVHALDGADGSLRRSWTTGIDGAQGLAFDRRRFVIGSASALHFVDAESLELVRRLPVTEPVVGITHEDDDYVCMTRTAPTASGDEAAPAARTRLHRLRIAPPSPLPVVDDELVVRVVVDARGRRVGNGPTTRLEGHRYHWEIGAQSYWTRGGLITALAILAARETRGFDGVQIQPSVHSLYEDVSRTHAAAKNAGFEQVRIVPGGGR